MNRGRFIMRDKEFFYYYINILIKLRLRFIKRIEKALMNLRD